jgi:tRNA modification GTPase
LINLLARREVAIVSPHAGTTRDVIEVQLDLDGYPVTLIDTAGIRDTEDPIEQEGVRRARSRAGEADLVLWVTDAEHERGEKEIEATSAALWVVRNKIDLEEADRWAGAGEKIRPGQGAETSFRISANRGDGISELVAALAAFAQACLGSGEDSLIGRERQRRLLAESANGLRRALAVAGRGDELVAEELRAASQSLGRLLGRVDVEDILDKIFREFCIGK